MVLKLLVTQRPLRIYVDTSVVGGCFDREFADDSCRLMEAAAGGRIVLLISSMVTQELVDAPHEVRQVLSALPAEALEVVSLVPEVLALRTAYLSAGVVGRARAEDATHVAAATVARADAIVSWNFKHIVRLDRIKAFNCVNAMQGYGVLTILSPKEVRFDAADQG